MHGMHICKFHKKLLRVNKLCSKQSQTRVFLYSRTDNSEMDCPNWPNFYFMPALVILKYDANTIKNESLSFGHFLHHKSI